jgi:NAD(P)-dependent dehydrogenase (short-subunit alcohol dehydrogenase family)
MTETFKAGALRGVESAVQRRCLKKVQMPEDLIGPIVFLCSSDSDFMTGQTMIVDGGNMMI